MRLSVIIPTYQRPADLLRCLDGLRAQQRLPDDVLVGLRDDDRETLVTLATWDPGPLPLRIVRVELSDASEARNRCLALAIGEVIVLIDDDTVPRRDFLARIRTHFVEDQALGGLGGPDWIGGVELPQAERPLVVGSVKWWGRRIGNHHRGSRQALQVEWLKGANMSFRRAALECTRFGRRLRGHGAQFGEDVALSLDISRAGWKLLYDPAVAVDHFPGRLAPGADHRSLGDTQSLEDAAFNETVLLLDYLSLPGRVAFLLWHVVVGTRLLPGPLMALYQVISLRSLAGVHRSVTVLRGRLAGWWSWRKQAWQTALPHAPSMPPLERRETVHPASS
jgi:cellulose synthase/poly-beta-1,6-N-acetylglucosamine synthase-like glycosyltransferase